MSFARHSAATLRVENYFAAGRPTSASDVLNYQLPTMTPHAKKMQLQIASAFAMVYIFWGSTYLGIRIAVEEMPPFVMGGIRFLIAGTLMLAYCAVRGMKVRIAGK